MHLTPRAGRMGRGSVYVVCLCWALSLGLGSARLSDLDRQQAFIGYQEHAKPGSPTPGKECTDRQTSCDDWADSGECEKNPGFMLEACCGACAGLANAAALAAEALARSQAAHAEVSALVLSTPLGDIRISLRPDLSPVAVKAITKHAMEASAPATCRGCRIYRNEAVPPATRPSGPPYALVQGSLGSRLPPLKTESSAEVVRGTVCQIAGGAEFFVAVGPHPEWHGAFVVWGQVAEEHMRVVDRITDLPYRNFTHPQFKTVMRMMLKEIKFQMTVE